MKYQLEDEQRKCNQYSPGPVDDAEYLLRIVFNPEHINDENEVLPVAISTSDLSERGFSVERKGYANKEILENTINRQKQAVPDKRKKVGIAKFKCSEIRQLLYDNGQERSFIIIDEALENNPAHSAIYSAKERTKGQLRKLRMQLYPFLQKRYSLAEIFS